MIRQTIKMELLEHLRFDNITQLFEDLGGPEIGDVYLDGKKLREKYLVKNIVQAGDLILLCKLYLHPHKTFFGLFDIESKYRNFKIFIYDVKNNEFYEQKKSLKALFILKFFHKSIFYHEAFHSNFQDLKRVIKFNRFNFRKMGEEQVFEELQ